jgi:hypothetical protein
MATEGKKINFEALKDAVETAYLSRAAIFIGSLYLGVLALFLVRNVFSEFGLWAAIGFVLCDILVLIMSVTVLFEIGPMRKRLEKDIEELENEKRAAHI